MSKKTAKTPIRNDEPATLTMRLFEPGMSLLHRAGLGGLACTLRHIERQYDTYGDKHVPGGPWREGEPPWVIESNSVELKFGKPTAAGEFLKRLFAIAFQTGRDGLIFLPGQFNGKPSDEVLVAVQNGLTLTFLQHGKVRRLAKEPTTVSFDPEGDGRCVTVEYRRCDGFKHQDGWRELIESSGRLIDGAIEVVGPLSPGAVVRHVAFQAATRIEDPPARALSLYFAIVGCVVLPINRGCGVMLVPDVQDLQEFCHVRTSMSPRSGKECQIAGSSDAALQVQSRLRRTQEAKEKDAEASASSEKPSRQARRKSHETRADQIHRAKSVSHALAEVEATRLNVRFGLPACHVSTFRPTMWSTQQKSRVDTLLVPPGDDERGINRLDRFAIAWEMLPPKVGKRIETETVGRGKKARKIEKPVYFLADSLVRPLVADNLARDRPWYQGFVRLFARTDPVSKKPLWRRLFFEKEGLFAMTQSETMWKDQGEKAVVRAVHEALRRRFGAIAKENKGKPGTMKNRQRGEFDRWRLAFAGAKTKEDFRHKLCDLFARAGMLGVLRSEWEAVLPWLTDDSRWQLTRDLALLGLASYPRREGEGPGGEDADEESKKRADDIGGLP